MDDDPLVIGGTGGSGTRAVARIVARAGVFMGARTNRSEDALDLAEFDWRWGPELVRSGCTEEIRQAFEMALAAHLALRPAGTEGWGWKHPHSYLLLPFLAERFARLRFIQVVRDGRDIALSRNHNQVRLYGEDALGPGDPADPVRRIAFWAWANDRAAARRAELLGDRSMCVRLEDLCRAPEETTRRVLEFAGRAGAGRDLDAAREIVPPDSLGRGRRADPSLLARLEEAAGATLRRFGYLDEPGAGL